VKDLETSLDQTKEERTKYYKAIEALEQENEKLREENRRHVNDMQTMSDKLNRLTKVTNVHNLSAGQGKDHKSTFSQIYKKSPSGNVKKNVKLCSRNAIKCVRLINK